MFEQAFKNIDDVLHKDAGSSSELDYTEQTSWLLFLKYLDALEQDKSMEAALHGQSYAFFVGEPYRWTKWAAPSRADGKIDYNRALTGDDLREFVDQKLSPYLRGFTQRATGAVGSFPSGPELPERLLKLGRAACPAAPGPTSHTPHYRSGQPVDGPARHTSRSVTSDSDPWALV